MIFDFSGWIFILTIAFVLGILCLVISKKIKNEELMKKNKKIEKYIYVFISVIAIFLIIMVIDLIMNNYRNKEIVELTDEIIVQDLKMQDNHRFIIIGLLITMFSPFMIFIVQGIKEAIKKKDNKTLKNAIYVFVIICILGVVLKVAMLSSYKYKIDTTYDKWYITTNEISKMRKTSTSGWKHAGTPSYYIYIEGEDEELEISSETYKQLSEGCVLYVVRDENGEIRQVYSKEKYTYVGDKLNISN